MTDNNEIQTWRVIRSGTATGAWNMAVDEAILEAATRGDVPPTLRLYQNPPSQGISSPATSAFLPLF